MDGDNQEFPVPRHQLVSAKRNAENHSRALQVGYKAWSFQR